MYVSTFAIDKNVFEYEFNQQLINAVYVVYVNVNKLSAFVVHKTVRE